LANDEKKYPGGISAYTRLREQREQMQDAHEKGALDAPDLGTVALLSVAEELAGLSYLLDGIRYQTRGKN
jgi:CRISPR/Cas system-associated protein endoribonuclease Cas2